MRVVEAGLADLVDEDRVGLAQDVELVAVDGAGHADREARAGERMAADEGLRQAKLAAERAHLVLEQLAQRLDQLQVHALGQAADVVVRLDRHRRAAGERHALDHVGIERALREELRAADLLRLRLERLDEQAADDLALLLGVVDAVQLAEEQLGGIDVHERDVERAAEQLDDLVGLVQAHQAVVDEDAGELVADRLVDQLRRRPRCRRRRKARR